MENVLNQKEYEASQTPSSLIIGEARIENQFAPGNSANDVASQSIEDASKEAFKSQGLTPKRIIGVRKPVRRLDPETLNKALLDSHMTVLENLAEYERITTLNGISNLHSGNYYLTYEDAIPHLLAEYDIQMIGGYVAWRNFEYDLSDENGMSIFDLDLCISAERGNFYDYYMRNAEGVYYDVYGHFNVPYEELLVPGRIYENAKRIRDIAVYSEIF